MKLSLYFTLTCNARCAHCVTLASPKNRRKMSLEEARRVVEAVARTPVLSGICFTGGENFVHAAELLELVRECRRRDLATEVISNAFWGTSLEAAVRTIRPFREAGLEMLRLSMDRYHLPYIPAERLRTALAAMAEVGFHRHVTTAIDRRYVVSRRFTLFDRLAGSGLDPATCGPDAAGDLARATRVGWPEGLVELLAGDYGLDLEECVLIDDLISIKSLGTPQALALVERLMATHVLVQYQFVAAEGRGRCLEDELSSWTLDETTDTVCDSVGSTPTVTPEGNVFPCCSSWVNFTRHRIGNLAEADLPDLIARIGDNAIARFMHDQGPRALIRFLRDRGHDLPERYTHPCHLCGTALERYTTEELLGHIEDFYREQPWRRIFTTRGVAPELGVAP